MLDELKANTKLTSETAARTEKRLASIRSAMAAKVPRLQELIENELVQIREDMLKVNVAFQKSVALTQWIFQLHDRPDYKTLTSETVDSLLTSLHHTSRAANATESLITILEALRKYRE